MYPDCSNPDEAEDILVEPVSLIDETINLGVDYDATVFIEFKDPAFKTTFAYDTEVCSSITTELEHNIDPTANLLGAIIDCGIDCKSFHVYSNIANVRVLLTDPVCTLAYGHDLECTIDIEVKVKLDMQDDNYPIASSVETVATQARGTITYISECLGIGARFSALSTTDTNNMWHLSTLD